MDTSRCLVILVLLAGCLLGANHSARADELLRTKMLADNCAVCHGTNCVGSLAIPNINGVMSAEDFLFKMNGFYFGDENATVMDRVARGLSRDQLNDLAYYFAKVNRSR
jgi:cytochrome c553